MHLGSDAFVGMDRLRFLKFSQPIHPCKIHLPDSGLDLLPPELRMLWWDGYPSKSLPSKFSPHNLVELRIRHSPLVQTWDGVLVRKFVNLRWFDLSYCANLAIVPDLSKATHLESLKLTGCKSIVELPAFVEYLDKLVLLDLGYCENLEILPQKLGSKQLKHIILYNCRKINQCPQFASKWETLDLHGTPVTTLPAAIHRVKEARKLYLHGKNITNFPEFSTKIKEFRLCHTLIEKMPPEHCKYLDSLPRFAQLVLIENSKLGVLSRTIWKLVSSKLIIVGSPMLETLPELIQELDQLRTLDVSHCKSLESIPSGISRLQKLAQIYLVGCESIRSLPQLPENVKTLAAGCCTSLQAVSSNNFGKLRFRHLSFVSCLQLDHKLLGRLLAKLPLHDVLYPGSEIPEWFPYKKMGDSVTVPLPRNCRRLKGIALAIVYSVRPSSKNAAKQTTDMHIHMKCACFSNSDGGHDDSSSAAVTSWNICMSDLHDSVSTDHVFLFVAHKPEATPSSVQNGDQEEEEAWYVKYSGLDVTFRFCIHAKHEDVKHCKIKQCGVSLTFHSFGNL
ncbi:unnamed protein product [Linum tenue]|uniref:C-JID domain-containing protein n=1 Tax=Linum tenue TaxID=586396 RepID=A0AAV0N4Q8_9ROSI|nr:unnamed protein product [Linum tenue]